MPLVSRLRFRVQSGFAVTAVAAGALLLLPLHSVGNALAATTPAAPTPSASNSAPTPSPTAGQQPSDAGDRAAFGVAPATKGKPDGRPNFTYSVTPGGQQLDQVAVVNIGVSPVTLRLYATDARPTSNGLFDLLPGIETPKDVGSWIALGNGKDKITVPARSRIVVPIRLVVPQDAAPGDHTGGILASLETAAKNDKGDTVTLEQRVASRLRVRVSGELKPELSIDNMKASFSAPRNPLGKGTMRVRYSIRNTGNVRLTGKQTLKVTGWFGTSAQATDLVDVPELLPGSSFDVSSVIDGVSRMGRLTATAQVTPVGRPEDANPPLTAVSRSVSVWTIPWLLVVLLILAGLVYRRWRRRRERQYERALSPAPIGPSSETDVQQNAGGSRQEMPVSDS